MDENRFIDLMDELNKLRDEVKYLKDLNNQKNKINISDEKILKEEEKRFVIFPIKENEIWKHYKKAEANFWTTEEQIFQKI